MSYIFDFRKFYSGSDIPISSALKTKTLNDTPEVKNETTVPSSPNFNFRKLQTLFESTPKAHQYKNDKIDVGKMDEFLKIAEEDGVYMRVTSGYRKDAYAANGNVSNHSKGLAIDITPIEGESWDDLITKMRNSKKLRKYMKDNKMRILDERSKDILAKTKGTGEHLHISFGKTEGENADTWLT